jgi:hypothetical protein
MDKGCRGTGNRNNGGEQEGRNRQRSTQNTSGQGEGFTARRYHVNQIPPGESNQDNSDRQGAPGRSQELTPTTTDHNGIDR